MTTRFVQLLTVILAASLFGTAFVSGQENGQQSGKEAAAQLNLPPPVGVKVATLPTMGPHWVFIQDPISNITINSISLIDGDSLRTLGMLSGGMESDFGLSPDHRHLYLADTYWSRGTRGARTDVVTIYDAKTLNPTGEVIIPPRQLSIPDHTQLGVTTDSRFLLVTNMTPATSVTVIDLNDNKFVGKIDTPNCTEIFVTGARSFSSICSDGSMMSVTMNDSGKAVASKRSGQFFDPEKDPVFGYPAMIGKVGNFVSFHGVVHPVDFSGAQARVLPTWPLLNAAQQAEGWLPGGWQAYWAHQGSRLLYVLMHQGGAWSHRLAGTQVWVYDVRKQRRIDTIMLAQPANSIVTTQDANPLLFAVTMHSGSLQVYSASNGRYHGSTDLPAPMPWTMWTP
jgi:methylamine dehydrogenase heavy chain